ncbi:OmpA family protein [Geobacter sp. OR-1]|uniref:OmpA family protein n=1 Tax=Geobacter sp. OR-1 TaxID=1266765 RepID=UPI0005A85EFD|nr:OmpA family protein [Geobacter sp. OR-1]
MGFVYEHPAFAVPSQNGSTGLITVPSAETLDAGNLSAGIWGNLSNKDSAQYFVLPATITMGMGSFIEVFGTYPNLLFNKEEDYSDRNSADLGMKIRLYGMRTSNLKIAADMTLQRRISQNPAVDGTTDYGGRLLASYKTDQFGVHAYGGYATRQLSADELLYGTALELSITPRVKIFTELTGSRYLNDTSLEGPFDADVGLQYFLSPYLTLSLAAGKGLTDASPDWRFIFGVSTSTGLGSYIKPIPKLESEIQAEAAKQVVIKPVKIIPISPKLVKAPAPAEAVSKIEVPLEMDKEEIVVRTYGQIILPPQNNETARPFIPPPPQDIAAEKETTPQELKVNKIEDQPPTYGLNVKGEAPVTPKPEEKLVAYRRFRFPDVVGYFQQGQAELTPEAKKLLADLAEQIRADNLWSYLRIDAYTDSIGSQKYNFDLSLRRAIEVASYLINREGLDSSRIFVRGMGSANQLADNQTEVGRKMNRRFEILFLQRDEKK